MELWGYTNGKLVRVHKIESETEVEVSEVTPIFIIKRDDIEFFWQDKRRV